MDFIRIQGARTHNLKNIDLELPRDKLIVITGLSGSGKSSLAFDTIYAEGQRRYVESLSAYARQFLSIMEKPDVDHIEGLSPAISIEQKSTSHNPRSTVGTITEIYDYLRLLYARAGIPRCPEHGTELQAQTVSQMVDHVLSLPEGSKIMLLAPIVRNRKGEHLNVFKELRAQGFVRARIDGDLFELDDVPELDLRKKHTIEAVVDRLKIRDAHDCRDAEGRATHGAVAEGGANVAGGRTPGTTHDQQQRLADSFETTLALTDGIATVAFFGDKDSDSNSSIEKKEELVFSAQFACAHCGYSLPELEPRMFSFNNPAGACSGCDGLGVKQFFDPNRVVRHPELSLPAGAIRGWDRRNAYYFQMVSSLAKHYGFDIDTPFEELEDNIRDVILNGSGEEEIEFHYFKERYGDLSAKKNQGKKSGDSTNVRTHPFEGILPNMDRRYHETDSNVVREELAKYLNSRSCPDCDGTRLAEGPRNVFVAEKRLPEITALPVGRAQQFFEKMELDGHRGKIAEKIVKEISQRLDFLVNVGLDYLSLNRSADTLSGGEAQRIRLASQIGAGLVGVMYVLDEPSIGLHQRDNQRLLNTLVYLRDMGNTVIVVEHDEEAIAAADHVLDIGPGAGVHGGEIVAQGTPQEIMDSEASLTGQYLSGRKSIAIPDQRTAPDPKHQISIRGANGNNLKNVDVDIPVGLMTAITGVSGSGKSTLINDTLFRNAAQIINNNPEAAAPCTSIDGLEQFDKVVDIDQSPIGRTPRSNPATYAGLFTPIREIFAGTQEARSRGYTPGRFSFNVKGGRCEACRGDGVIKVEMHFLPDIYVPCDVCKGKRYNRETLEIKYKGLSIYEVLEQTVEDARIFFDAIPSVSRKLQTLMDVGLSYIRLGQNATTLSGGEAQRVKLARELSKRDTGNTLYILDEPTTGLHFHDIEQLLVVLHRLRDHGNTIVVIEHNLDVIKTTDWVIDLGPEGGENGGTIITTGTPEQIAEHADSYTGHYLKPVLERKKPEHKKLDKTG